MRVDVCAGIGNTALDLFGREVGDGSDEESLRKAAGLRGDDCPGQARSRRPHATVGADQDVLRLDVAVRESAVVGCIERFSTGSITERASGRVRRLRFFRTSQCLPVDVFHRQIDEAVSFALIEYPDNRR